MTVMPTAARTAASVLTTPQGAYPYTAYKYTLKQVNKGEAAAAYTGTAEAAPESDRTPCTTGKTPATILQDGLKHRPYNFPAEQAVPNGAPFFLEYIKILTCLIPVLTPP